jgi:NAD(P)-dependent dehydrogenase (short-subunit alcohol dehydrogenase family)
VLKVSPLEALYKGLLRPPFLSSLPVHPSKPTFHTNDIMFVGDLNGKTALVTGGGSGISLAFTLRLLEAGCNVVVADLALSPEAQALDKYTTTPKAVFQKTDVTDWAQLDAAFQTALTTFGSLDIVCPGAGLSEPVSSASFS